MQKKKWIFYTIIILFIVFLISFFVVSLIKKYPKNLEISVEQPKTKIRFSSNWGNQGLKGIVLAEFFNKYVDEHSNVDIVNESMSGDAFLIKLQTDFASRYYPDIISLKPGSLVRFFFKENIFADFQVETDAEITFDNCIFGVPTEANYLCVYINKDLFDKYEIPVPQNYDQLKTAVLRFNYYGITPIAFSAMDSDIELYQALVAALSRTYDSSHNIVDDTIGDRYIKALYLVKELHDMGAFPNNYNSLDYQSMLNLFIQKEAAMIVESSDAIGRMEYNSRMLNMSATPIKSISGNNIEIIAFPNIMQENHSFDLLAYGAGESTYYMSSFAYENNYDETLRLLKSITSPEISVTFLNNAKAMITVKTRYSPVRAEKLLADRNILLSNAGEFVEIPTYIIDNRIWQSVIKKRFPEVMEGHMKAEDVWAEAIKMLNSIER